jgi:hypothetical protein
VAWRSNVFLFVMLTLVFTVGFSLIAGIIILTLLAAKEKQILDQIPKFINSSIGIGSIVTSNLFCYAFNNIIMGHFLCVGTESENPDDYAYPQLTLLCDKNSKVLMYISIVGVFLHILPTILIRLFIFYFEYGENDIFITQSGLYSAMQYVLISILSFVSIFVRHIPVVSSIVGMLLNFISVYLFLIQRYCFLPLSVNVCTDLSTILSSFGKCFIIRMFYFLFYCLFLLNLF